MTTPTLTPASAAAAAKCRIARAVGGGVTLSHPRRCGWCDYALADLARMIAAFDPTSWEARRFTGQPPSIQAAEVLAAQAFEPEPMPAPELPPADAASTWFDEPQEVLP